MLTIVIRGLRNDVGIDEDPITGALYSVENSADEVTRNGVDIHENNPAERMNFLGWLQPPEGTPQYDGQGANFGYPHCFAAWDPSGIPGFGGKAGDLFAIGDVEGGNSDATCQNQYTAPRLVFQAHMAPLDIKFNSKASEAWIAFHGSWDRTQPSGYKVGALYWNDSNSIAQNHSRTALIDIVTNQDNSKCPDECFRPVAMAWDSQDRLYFSSDSTGEIYVITRTTSRPGEFPTPPSSTDGDSTSSDGSASSGSPTPSSNDASLIGSAFAPEAGLSRILGLTIAFGYWLLWS